MSNGNEIAAATAAPHDDVRKDNKCVGTLAKSDQEVGVLGSPQRRIEAPEVEERCPAIIIDIAGTPSRSPQTMSGTASGGGTIHS